MLDQPTAMHVARIRSSHTDKQGREQEYESRLLRHTYRDGGKVRHKTLANLSQMPPSVVDAVEAALKDEVLVPAGQAAVTVSSSRPGAGHRLRTWWIRGSTAWCGSEWRLRRHIADKRPAGDITALSLRQPGPRPSAWHVLLAGLQLLG
jgi:hypothetical protein